MQNQSVKRVLALAVAVMLVGSGAVISDLLGGTQPTQLILSGEDAPAYDPPPEDPVAPGLTTDTTAPPDEELPVAPTTTSRPGGRDRSTSSPGRGSPSADDDADGTETDDPGAVPGDDDGGPALPAGPTTTTTTEPPAATDPPRAHGTAPFPDATITVDGDDDLGPATRVGQGFLNATYTVPPLSAPWPEAEVDALAPESWRISVPLHSGDPAREDFSPFDRARAAGAEITLMVDVAWFRQYQLDPGLVDVLCGGGIGNATAPWQDWGAYRSFIRDYVTDLVSVGRVPDYWEPFNEPGPTTYNRCQAFTPQLQLEVWRATYEEIRRVIPDARVVGPALAMWVYDGDPSRSSVDLAGFVDWAYRNGIDLGGITWHELGAFRPEDVADHVRTMRQLLDSRGMTGTKIMVNEYLSSPWNDQPGWIAGYLTAFNDGGADQAMRSCTGAGAAQDFCFQTNLNGLFDRLSLAPRAPYWTHEFYGSMTGTRVATAVSSSSDDGLSMLAVRDDDDTSLRLLLGRHDAFRERVAGGPVDASVAVRAPWVADRYRVVAHRLATGVAAGSAGELPVALDVVVSTDRQGFVTFTLPAVADGEAVTVTLTPLAG